MENTDQQQQGVYEFLTDQLVEKHFADLNSKLLSGKHIQTDDYYIFQLLEQFGEQWELFYERLYGLRLSSAVHDHTKYYYLELFSQNKGKFSDPGCYRALTPLQSIIGLMLLNMYYSKYFENPKIITWTDIRNEILLGDFKDKYQRILFEQVRDEYRPSEWAYTKSNFKNTVNSFHEFGWLKKISGQNDEIQFEINASIHRMAELYKEDLENFDLFSDKVANWREE